MYIYIYIYIYEGHPKHSMPHPERRTKAEHFYCGNKLLLLIKLEKFRFVLISVQVRLIQR